MYTIDHDLPSTGFEAKFRAPCSFRFDKKYLGFQFLIIQWKKQVKRNRVQYHFKQRFCFNSLQEPVFFPQPYNLDKLWICPMFVV